MQVNSKNFGVELLIKAVSLVCSLKPIGTKFSIAANAFCFSAFFFNHTLH